MSEQLRDYVTPIVQAAPDEIAAEHAGLRSFLGFVREHKEIYRIIDEAEFVDYASYRRHYETTVERIRQRLADRAARSETRPDAGQIHARALAGMKDRKSGVEGQSGAVRVELGGRRINN